MKTKRFTQLAVTLALCTFALAACTSGTTNNANNANNANNTNANTAGNKNTATTPGATAKGDFSSPTAAFKSFYDAAKGNDIETMKRSMSKRSMDFMQKGAAKENKSVDDAFKEMNKDAPAAAPETRGETITGDKATLEVKDEKMDKWEKISFAKEDGQWKIAMFDELADAMDKLDSLDKSK
ncbi:MAG: hypothetical protein H7Y30_03250 [Pyrinomonadaceae bacterium]|nr:hypothetical protein [Pyrinomonadaceae bacterium]